MKTVEILVIRTLANGGNYKITSNHRTDDEDVAIGRAIVKHWGCGCGFFPSHSLGIGYGYITKPNKWAQATDIVQSVRVHCE